MAREMNEETYTITLLSANLGFGDKYWFDERRNKPKPCKKFLDDVRESIFKLVDGFAISRVKVLSGNSQARPDFSGLTFKFHKSFNKARANWRATSKSDKSDVVSEGTHETESTAWYQGTRLKEGNVFHGTFVPRGWFVSTSTLQLSKTGGVNMLKAGCKVQGQKFTGRFVPEGYIVMNDDLTIHSVTGHQQTGKHTPAGQVPPGLGKEQQKREQRLNRQHGEDYSKAQYGYGDDDSYHSEFSAGVGGGI